MPIHERDAEAHQSATDRAQHPSAIGRLVGAPENNAPNRVDPERGLSGQALVGARVLLVDDSEINQQVTRRILELEGAEVCLANNGHEAVEFLRNDRTAIDIVLMDIQMPVLNGFDATERIRVELMLQTLIIIALTAGALSSERQRAFAVGMNDFIVKPYDAQALLCCVLRHFDPTGGPLAPLRGGIEDTFAQEDLPWPEVEGIDAKDVSMRLGGDRGLFLMTLKGFLREFSDLELPTVLCDAAGLIVHANLMHKLRGVAGMLGAIEIMRLASEAESACWAGEVERAARLVIQISTQMQRVSCSAEVLYDDLELQPQPPTPAETTPPDSENSSNGGEPVKSAMNHIADACSEFLLPIQTYLEEGPFHLTCEPEG